MPANDTDKVTALLQQRFEQLPPVVQEAITSADVTQHMRELAQARKLHMDQWEKLETVVRLTLLAVHPIEDLAKNIKDDVGVSDEDATSLARDISGIVFEPIRQEMERQLAHPEAREKQADAMEAARTGAMEEEKGNDIAAQTPAPTAPSPTPAPPAPPPPVSAKPASYLSNTPSHERPGIEGDPYREQVG